MHTTPKTKYLMSYSTLYSHSKSYFTNTTYSTEMWKLWKYIWIYVYGCVALLWHNAKVLALSKVLTLIGNNQSFDYSPLVLALWKVLTLWHCVKVKQRYHKHIFKRTFKVFTALFILANWFKIGMFWQNSKEVHSKSRRKRWIAKTRTWFTIV